MITVQDAIAKALEFYQSLPIGKPKEILLEEVEFSEKNRIYLITLGYNVEEITQHTDAPLSAMFGNKPLYKREYKIFEVEADTGKVKSMKIRKI